MFYFLVNFFFLHSFNFVLIMAQLKLFLKELLVDEDFRYLSIVKKW